MTTRPLRYETSGSGPPVVLIHGLGTTSDVWCSLRNVLDSDFHVITYDRSRCGLSPRRSASFSIDAWVDELVDLLDQLGVDETAVVRWMPSDGFLLAHGVPPRTVYARGHRAEGTS